MFRQRQLVTETNLAISSSNQTLQILYYTLMSWHATHKSVAMPYTHLRRIASERYTHNQAKTDFSFRFSAPFSWLIPGPTSFGNEGLQPAVKDSAPTLQKKKTLENDTFFTFQ